MSVLVEHKENTTPGNSRPNCGGPPSSTSVIKRGVRERQKVESSAESRAPGDGAKEMNIMAVERVDPGLCDILSTVPQVVLYQYESNSNTWVSYTYSTCTHTGANP